MFRKLLAIATLAVSATFFAGQAEAYNINVAGWKGGSYNSRTTGNFSHCVVSAKYKRGDRLLLSINRKYIFSLGIADSRWNLRKGSKYDVTLQVDRRQRFFRTAVAVSSRQLVIRINDRATFFKMMRRGRTLWIDANGLNRGYSLRGTRKALNATLRCVKYKLRYASNDGGGSFDQPRSVDQPRESFSNSRTKEKPQQFAGLPPKTPLTKKRRRAPNAVSNERALIYSINLLSDAGISGYKLLEKNPFRNAGYQVAWRYSKGKRGALATFKNRKPGFVDTQTAKILGSDAKSCKGKFASGFRKSDSGPNWSGRRLFTVCSNASNGNDFTIHYSIGLQPSGVATIVATHVNRDGMDDPDGDDSEKIDQAIYRSTVFRKIGK